MMSTTQERRENQSAFLIRLFIHLQKAVSGMLKTEMGVVVSANFSLFCLENDLEVPRRRIEIYDAVLKKEN